MYSLTEKLDQPSKPSDESVRAQPLRFNRPVNNTKTKRLVIKRRPTISQSKESQTKLESEAMEQLKGNSIAKKESTQHTSTSTRLNQVGTLSDKDDESVKTSEAEHTLSSQDNTNTSELSIQTLLSPEIPPTRLSQDFEPTGHSSIKTYLERVDSTSHDESLLAEMASLEQELVETDGSQVDSLSYSKDDVDLMLEMEEFI